MYIYVDIVRYRWKIQFFKLNFVYEFNIIYSSAC